MILRLLSAYFFSLECLYLYLIVLFIYETKNLLPSSLAIISVLILANLFLIYSEHKSQVSRVIPFFAGIICGGISYTLGLNSVSSILCGSFVFFRIEAFLKDSSLWNDERNKFQLIFYFTSLVVLFFGWTSHYSYMNLIIGLVIVFTILFSLGRYFQQAVSTHTIKNSRSIIVSIIIATLITGLVMLILPFFKWGIFKLLDGLFKTIGFLGSPFFNYIDHINIKEKKLIPGNNSNVQNEVPQKIKNQSIALDSIPSWVWLLLLIITLLVIWLVLRKLNYIRTEKNTLKQEIGIEHTSEPVSFRRKIKLFKQTAPADQIRKLIFQLQKYASKYKMGRYQNETLKEWLDRIQILNEEELINAYDSVRYGNVEFKDIEKFEEHVKQIKEKIKSRDKDQNLRKMN